jgi:hypothetical protein
VTDGAAVRGAGPSRRALLVMVAAGIAAACLVNAFSTSQDLERVGRPAALWQPFLWEASSAAVIVALLPAAHALFRRSARWHGRPVLWAASHLAGMLAFSVLHVGGMVLLRQVGYALAGETYVFGPPVAGFVYELRKDVLTYVLVMAVFWIAERLGPWNEATGAAGLGEPVAAPPPALWLRDATVNLKVAPADIVWVASAANYVEFALASGARHLIRTTLQAEEERLSPLGFVRIHRTRLVNGARLKRLASRPTGDFEVEMDTGERFSGSRRHRAEALARLGLRGDQAGCGPS